MTSIVVFRLGQPGVIWTSISKDGKTDNVIVQNIIHAMKRGKHTSAGYEILCVPDVRDKYGNLSSKDATTLGALFAKPKNRGSNSGLITIANTNRYRGKIDWEDKRPLIARLLRSGKSVSEVARRIRVTPSALSKANKRHNLYPSKQPPCK